MTPYRVHVRIELSREDTQRVVLHDTHDHYFEGSQASAHGPFDAVENAVIQAMAALVQSKDSGESK